MSKNSSSVSHGHRLDKALFAAGIQCAKRLYLEYHSPKSSPPPSESRQSFAEMGQRLAEMAREGFPKGDTIDEPDHAKATAKTKSLLEKEGDSAIFNAAFERDGVEIRCDILLPNRDGESLDIFEVKAGTKVKPRHVMDVALQMWVIEGINYKVNRASLLHLDAGFCHDGAEAFPIHKLFKNVDVTKKARKRKRRIAEYIENFQHILDDETTLELPTGTWCINPIPCNHLPNCRKSAPAHPLLELPDLTPAQESELHLLGIESIEQIDPKTESLTPMQRRVLGGLSKGSLVAESVIREEFETIVFPVCFVSAGLALQVLPRFPQSRPWQHLPFQWNAQIIHEDGKVEYRTYLADGSGDPRSEFVATLARCIEDVGTVVTWSRRLEPTLRQIMEDFPDLKQDVRGLLQMDPIALDLLVREGVYHPGMHGSYEISSVRAALMNEETPTSGAGLIVDDDAARSAFERLLNPRIRSTTRSRLKGELEEYGAKVCSWMVDIYKTLGAT